MNHDLWWFFDQPDGLYGTDILLNNDAYFGEGAVVLGSVEIVSASPHVLFVVQGTPGAFGTAPSNFQFFTNVEMTVPANVMSGFSHFQIPGVGHYPEGDKDCFAYLYVVENSADHLYMIGAGGADLGLSGSALVGIDGMEAVGASGQIAFEPAYIHDLAPQAGTGDGGLWVYAAFSNTAASANIALTPTPFEKGANGVYPSVGIGGAGEESDPVRAVISDNLDGEPAGMIFAFVQLLSYVPAVPVVPPTTVITSTFTGSIDLVGAHRSLPSFDLTSTIDGTLDLPTTSSEWWAVMVDSAGRTIARMPDAVIGEIVETLNDITTVDVTIPINSRAGSIVDETVVVPDLEVQVWRGDTLWVWGPIVDPVPEQDHWRLSVNDCRWHLSRRHVGELGGSFGGKPPYFHDPMLNERFATGDLTGWSIFRTVTVGEFVGFDTPDPAAVFVDGAVRVPDGSPMAGCIGPLDPLDNYQLYQDLTVHGPQNDRELQVTLSGWWFIPGDSSFAPNNLQMGFLLATLDPDIDLPAGYYAPTDWKFDTLDATAPRDELFYREASITLPAGESLLHVSVCFPQGVAYVGGIELQVDDGLLYNESPSTIGPGLVMHAQDPAFAKSDVNIDWAANTIGDQVIREYVFRDHTNIGSAIQTLASEGWFDWDVHYSTTGRTVVFTAPTQGGHRPRSRCRLDRNGRGNVARIERRRMWQSASTVVAAQTRSNGNHERAARSEHDLTLEEVFVAPREPRDYDLEAIARTHLDPAADAEVVEVTSLAGDERILLDLRLGDTTDVLGRVPGHRVSGKHRVARRSISPGRDSAVVTMNPA